MNDTVELLPHHYKNALSWSADEGSPEELAEIWVTKLDRSYNTKDPVVRQKTREGIVLMIGAVRNGRAVPLKHDWDISRPEFGDFFCRSHCDRYRRPSSMEGCGDKEKFDYFKNHMDVWRSPKIVTLDQLINFHRWSDLHNLVGDLEIIELH